MVEYSALDILKVVFRRIWLIVIVGVLCAVIAYIYCSMLATPTYQAKSSIIGSNGNIATDVDTNVITTNDSVAAGDLTASLSLTETYVYMLTKMPTESENFINKLNDAGLVDYFNNASVNITAREDTLIIDIAVVSTDREVAKQIANIYAECSSEFIEGYNVGMIKELSKARSTTQVSPQTFIATALACILGVFITALIVIFLAISDRTINGEDDLKNNYDIPILGVVPDFQISVNGGK